MTNIHTSPVEVLLQQVKALLHLSIGEVSVTVVPSWSLLTLDRLLRVLSGRLLFPPICVMPWKKTTQSELPHILMTWPHQNLTTDHSLLELDLCLTLLWIKMAFVLCGSLQYRDQ